MDSSNTILVVDDDSAIVELIAEVLEDEGYRVRATTNSQEVLTLVHIERPALILVDLHMPYMNGIDVIEQLRTSGFADLPVVLVTASSDKGIGMADLAGRAYLLKPFDIGELTACVARYMPSAQQQTFLQQPARALSQPSSGAANDKMIMARGEPATPPIVASSGQQRQHLRSKLSPPTTSCVSQLLRAWHLMSTRRRVRGPMRTAPLRHVSAAAVVGLDRHVRGVHVVPATVDTAGEQARLRAQTTDLIRALMQQYDRAIAACQHAAALLQASAQAHREAREIRAQVAQAVQRRRQGGARRMLLANQAGARA